MLADGRVAVANARRSPRWWRPEGAGQAPADADDVAIVASRAKGMTGDAAEILGT